MNKHFLRIVTILLVSLMLIPTVSSVAASNLNKVVVVGSIDPALGYDVVVNGTTTFRVARSQPVSKGTFYHNVTRFEWKRSPVETSPETPGSYYDNLTGKYYYDTLVAEPYNLTVPDPSGKVTVFSNMVFQGTGWNPKSKIILHPDGTSQSILHVKGQASGDPSARYLVVTICNSKYPGGYQVDYTVVHSSFDKSYDVTNIVAERDVNTISIVVTTYEGKWDVQSYFWVSTIGTDVYIVMIPDVPTSYVSDMDAVRRGVETACMVTPLVHLDTWKGLTYLEVVDMPTYEYIIQYPENVKPPGFHGETGIIVVNAHGEVLPCQPGCNWDTWVRVIRQHVQRKALTWVQVGGYPFYYYSKGSHAKTEVGPQGFQLFLEMILGPNSIDCWPNQEGYAVPLQGGYSNRLWGYGLTECGLHEGRPLKIDSSTNLADLLDVMGYRSGGIEYLTLGLIGFAFPNQTVQKPDERVGYYVHNGALDTDNDFNKGKYSMAVAAWTKISILAVGYADVYYEDYWGNKYYVGSFTSTVAWSYAVPPASSTAPWTIRFVTITFACMKLYGPFGYQLPFGLWAPLKLERSSSTTTFEFISSQSTTLEDASEQSWQNTITQGFLGTAIAVILVPVTLGWSVSAQVVIAIALGFASTVTAVAYASPSPVTSGDYIDLALDDYSSVPAVDEEGTIYLQLQSYAVVEAYLTQSANGGASETITFTSGQKAWYVDPNQHEYYLEKTLSFPVSTIVEPYTSADVNHQSETPSTPSGPTSGYRNVWYTYSTSTTDPDGDDVRYQFEFTGPSTNVSFTTGWYASGQTGSLTVMWETTDPLGTYYVRARAQDVYEEWSNWSPYLTVSISSGGGCPYVYTWDGQQYVMDNNLLPASETSNGADVEDRYMLEQPLVPMYQVTRSSVYSLQIREFEHEHDYLDQVKLLAVDHSSNVNVAVSPYGEILTYSNPAPAIFAVDDNGVDVLSLLSSVDGNYYQGYNGSHITITFTSTDVSNGIKLVIRDDWPPVLEKCPVYVQVLNATEDWNTVATFHTRTYWATDIINMTDYLPDANGDLKVRLCFVSNDKIDYVGLDTTPQASIEVHQALLLSAFHSTQGNIKPLLMKNDQTYAELTPGQQIQLTFQLPNNRNKERTFILCAEGHYSTIAP
jgi:hypothetical protein